MRAADRRRARGLSLIEVLVSTVVISVGALSATSLQLVTKRNNRDAAQRLEATHLASTVIERMRANNSPEALRVYATLAPYSPAEPRPMGGGALDAALGLDCAADTASCCLGSASACDGGQIARVELWHLEQVMDGVMEQIEGVALKPGGLDSPSTCTDGPEAAGRDGFYTVTIAFRGALAMADDPDVPCGRDATDAQGNKLYGENNEFRRTLTVSAFITPTVRK